MRIHIPRDHHVERLGQVRHERRRDLGDGVRADARLHRAQPHASALRGPRGAGGPHLVVDHLLLAVILAQYLEEFDNIGVLFRG